MVTLRPGATNAFARPEGAPRHCRWRSGGEHRYTTVQFVVWSLEV